jgi:hypothetical protein
MAGPFHLRDAGILKRARRTNMKRRTAKAVAAWENEGGARLARPRASAARSRNRELKSGDRIVPGNYSGARMTTVSGPGKL